MFFYELKAFRKQFVRVHALWSAIPVQEWQTTFFSFLLSLKRDALLIVAFGVLLTFSFPNFFTPFYPDLHFSYLAWVGLIPLLFALKDRKSLSAFRVSFFAGTAFFLGMLYWINVPAEVGVIDFFSMVCFHSVFFGLFGALYSVVTQSTLFPSWIIAPPLWVVIEYLRSHFFFLALPWALLGHTQYPQLILIQMSTLVGVYGISYLIVFVNCVFYELWCRSKNASLGLLFGVVFLGGVFVFGYHEMATPLQGDPIRLTVVQGNIPQETRWDPYHQGKHYQKHVQLTRDSFLRDSSSNLIIWPETSVPATLHLLKGSGSLSQLARELQTPFLVGTATRGKFGNKNERKQINRFNRALLISQQGKVLQHYNKVRLFPFGEYLPYRDILPWPTRISSHKSNFLPGKEVTLFSLPGANGVSYPFGVLICWETLFPELTREFVNKGATFIVNIANEAWFGPTAAPYQFFIMNAFRAVENRVYVARAVNTGVSGFIDPFGRIVGRVHNAGWDVFVEGTLTHEIQALSVSTFYSRNGDVFVWGMMVVSLGLVLPALVLLVRKKRPQVVRDSLT